MVEASPAVRTHGGGHRWTRRCRLRAADVSNMKLFVEVTQNEGHSCGQTACVVVVVVWSLWLVGWLVESLIVEIIIVRGLTLAKCFR